MGLTQEVAANDHRAYQGRVFVGKVGEESHDSSQAAVDGGGFVALGDLEDDEMVDIVEVDLKGRPVTHGVSEVMEVVGVIPPGTGLRITAVKPIDEVCDLG